MVSEGKCFHSDTRKLLNLMWLKIQMLLSTRQVTRKFVHFAIVVLDETNRSVISLDSLDNKGLW